MNSCENGNPSSSRGRHLQGGERRIGFIGMGRLNDWVMLKDNPYEIMIWMLSNVPELTNFLNSHSIKNEAMKLFMISLKAVLQVSSFDHSFSKLLKTLASTNFYRVHLMRYFSHWDPSMSVDVDTSLHYIIETSCRIPSFVSKCYEILKYIIMNYSSFQCEIDLLKKAVEQYNGAKQTWTKKTRLLLRKWRDDDEPPEDIRDISIFPTRQDMDKDFVPFLRENKTRGAYRNVGHYFDVIFRLMREDFIQPLKMGIANYRDQEIACRETDLMFYENVKILGLDVFNGIEHILLLDMKKYRGVRWDSEKRLIFGSLICLSNDNFKTIIYATVSQMDRNELKKGLVRVVFQNCLEDVYGFSSEDSLTMTENPSFFEAYRHVLEGLQEMLEETLPMEKYIVSCEKEIANPVYLNQLTKYDVSCLLKGNCSLSTVQVLTPSTWPNLTEVCLNECQYLAVKTALTHELTLIQGPPGTGKTYVGLKIIRCLLENAASRHEKNEPILVVCYTNHALDQFLEEMLPFCEGGIVRVGGNSDSEMLKNFNLSELRRQHCRVASVGHFFRDCHTEMDEIGQSIRKLATEIQYLSLFITHEKTLEPYILPRHFQQFHTLSGISVRAWLNSSDVDLVKHVETAVEAHLVKLFLSEKKRLTDTKLNFSAAITVEQKMRVYSYWRHLYEQSSFINSTHQKGLISESLLKRFIDEKVYKNIKVHCKDLKAWLLGSDVGKMLSAIEEIQSKRQLKVFDDKDEYKRVYEQRHFGDESDSEEGKIKGSKFRKSKMHILQKCKFLGIDIFSNINSEESAGHAWDTEKLTISQVIYILNTTKPMDESEEGRVISLWQLTLAERFRLYKCWLQRYQAHLNSKMRDLVEEYDSVYKMKLEQRQMESAEILQNSNVIGMTTTGAAKYRKLLQIIGPKVVIVEEAAEVLEAHIITALSKHCQHLILIGDHQQLRPKTEVYELAKIYGLEVSLFERLVKNNINCIQLNEQHRMKPEISKYMKHIYSNLKDSQSVYNREHVMGMDKDIFFITHDMLEGNVHRSKSKLNEYEANYLIKLAQYLVIQGYSSSDITILATYGGQVSLIKECLASIYDSALESLRVSTVDNFQGEQNKIILLSLVRSNRQGSVGFLSTDNRICVALSRAQYGMYVIGNIDLLSQHSDLWAKIKATAEANGEIGQHLQLRCKRHQNLTVIQTISDFDSVQNGGCGLTCRQVLPCGHVCPSLCHGISHDELICIKQCMKICKNGHKCQSLCSKKPCPPCSVCVEVPLSCKHTLKIKCHHYYAPLPAKCDQECNKFCIQGHKCRVSCSQSCPPCVEELKCGHICKNMPLYSAKPLCDIQCDEMCLRKCINGHSCPYFCVDQCPPLCTSLLPCQHPCGHTFQLENARLFASRQRNTIVCLQDCQKKCPRGIHICTGKCSEKCPPCPALRKYILSCGHTVELECSKDPANYECQQRCLKKCLNGHSCLSRCGDECPRSCTFKLPCQHLCGQSFDFYNPVSLLTRLRNKIVCSLACQKKCPRGLHPCKGKCSEKCPPCTSLIKYKFTCGHKEEIECHINPLKHRCNKMCLRKCINGHPCPNNCSDKCPPACTFLLPCQHPCGQSFGSDISRPDQNAGKKNEFVCSHSCQKKCPSGLHPCTGKCSEECPPCTVLRKYKFTCGHSVELECQKDPLKHRCEEMCLKKCINGHPCPSRCEEPCPSSCTSQLPCHHPCGQSFESDSAKQQLLARMRNKTVCSSACQKMCPRGCHPCTGKCSEKCPPCPVLIRFSMACGHIEEMECFRDPLKCNWNCKKCSAKKVKSRCSHSLDLKKSSEHFNSCPQGSLTDRFRNLQL